MGGQGNKSDRLYRLPVYGFLFKADQSKKRASHGRQEPQLTGTTKWATTLRFGKIVEQLQL